MDAGVQVGETHGPEQVQYYTQTGYRYPFCGSRVTIVATLLYVMERFLPPLLHLVQIVDRQRAKDSEQNHHAFGIWLLIRENKSVGVRQPVENSIRNVWQTIFTI